MAARQQKENYQRVLDQTIEQLTKEGKVPTLLLHTAVRPAAAMCWNTFLNTLKSRYYITTPIFPQKRNTRPV